MNDATCHSLHVLQGIRVLVLCDLVARGEREARAGGGKGAAAERSASGGGGLRLASPAPRPHTENEKQLSASSRPAHKLTSLNRDVDSSIAVLSHRVTARARRERGRRSSRTPPIFLARTTGQARGRERQRRTLWRGGCACCSRRRCSRSRVEGFRVPCCSATARSPARTTRTRAQARVRLLLFPSRGGGREAFLPPRLSLESVRGRAPPSPVASAYQPPRNTNQTKQTKPKRTQAASPCRSSPRCRCARARSP